MSIDSQDNPPSISILIPIYNGGHLAEKAYSAIMGTLTGDKACEVLFGNDGSADESLAILTALSKKHTNIRIDTHPNGGLGCTLNRLIAMARAEIAVYLDVDLSFDIAQLPGLIALLENADIAVASRYRGDLHHDIPISRRLCSFLYRNLSRGLLAVSVLDIGSGMVAFRRNSVRQLEIASSGFNWHVELYDKAARQGLRVEEVPTPYRHGKDGSFRILKHGPKLTGQLIQYAMHRMGEKS